MKRIILAVISALTAAYAADPPRLLHASFPDGTVLEIFTETTGSSPVSVEGAMGIAEDRINRVVVDRENNILFAYNLEASKGPKPNTVTIRIEPLRPETEAGLLRYYAGRVSGPHIPTVAAVREFPVVKIGEAVTLDILYNPSTGEKIFDVLRPMEGSPSGTSVRSVAVPEMISLKDISLRVNGRAMSAPASLMIGAAVRIDIPRLGTYVVAANDPRAASPDHAFAAIAHADGKTLSWTMNGERVEIASSTNVLTQAASGVLWVYHDAHYQPDVVGLQSADTVDWLLPRR